MAQSHSRLLRTVNLLPELWRTWPAPGAQERRRRLFSQGRKRGHTWKETGPSGSWDPSWECTEHLPTCGALAGKGQLSLWEQGQAMSCPIEERSRSPNTSPRTLTTGTLEDRCPAVQPNAGWGHFPGIWKRPWSQQLSQHMHGTCATVPLTCPVPVLAWPVLICPHLPAPSGVDHPGDPHLPLAWPSLSGIPISHLGSPHPLGPLIGFKSGGKNRLWP